MSFSYDPTTPEKLLRAQLLMVFYNHTQRAAVDGTIGL